LGREINRGSFGIVFDCFDEWDNPLVAKVLVPNDQTYEQVREKWEREFFALLGLRHPCVTFVHEAFEWRDTFYIIIEKCAFSLADLISVPNFYGANWVRPIARDLLQALDFIHKFGHVHKDIHPGNILGYTTLHPMDATVTEVRFKLADFGISRLEDEIDPLTTLVYQSAKPPEFFYPDIFGQPCRKADVYQAALCLLNVVLGQVRRFTPEEIIAGVPREIAESLPHPCGAALGRSLRRRLEYRTPTARALWDDLNISGQWLLQ
jgi:serine/threonine-protein kinase